MAAGDHAASRHDQLRAELRLRPVRPPRQGSRSRRAGSLVAGASPAAAPSRFTRRPSRRSPRSSRPSGSARPAFLPSYGLAEHVLAATFAPRGRGPARRGSCRPTSSTERVARPATRRRDIGRRRWSAAVGRFPGTRFGSSARTARRAANGRSARSFSAGPSVMLGYYKHDALTAADDPRRLAAHRRSRAISPAASCSSAAARRTSSSSTAGSTTRRISSGPSTIWPACGAAASSRSAPPQPGGPIASSSSSSRAARCRQTSLDRRDSAADRRSVRALRRRRRARAERHRRPDDERQSAARGDQGALRARRAGDEALRAKQG